MTQRENNLVWLKDMIDHLRECREQLQWADDPETVRLLTESMLRDLDCCRRLCTQLCRPASLPLAV